MKIKQIEIKNFRAIKNQKFSVKDLSILIGNNGTGKTSVLEAINFVLSPYYLSGKIKHTDFHNGGDDTFSIDLEFDSAFTIELRDGYQSQKIECNKVHLAVKKRDRASPGKAFSDGFVISHMVIPSRPKDNENGWEISRANGTKYKFDERHLALSQIDSKDFPRVFYFNKNRDRQLQQGYNSSIGSVFDDFNWRFLKQLRDEKVPEGEDDFQTKKRKFQDEMIRKVDEKAYSKCFEALNSKLKYFDLNTVGLTFIDGNAPFDNAMIAQQIGDLDMPVSNLGSGVEMIISVLFLETLASLSKENIILLIDEPELHLHPVLQNRFIGYLNDAAKTSQVIMSTHSPYFFKNCNACENTEILISRCNNGIAEIVNASRKYNLFEWSPSWGEINYFAYSLPTIEFHNELYGYLYDIEKSNSCNSFDECLAGKGILRDKKWVGIKHGKLQAPKDVTLITYIRHSIHHPENRDNNIFTQEELKISCESMIKIIESTKHTSVSSKNEDDNDFFVEK